ncbi:MAG: ATP-binding protein [Thermodesulfobacteriota bacterium]|nr:ATP-binding protein [Thermodesulfobacteriota bacterium]
MSLFRQYMPRMLKKINIRIRIYALLACIVFVTLVGGLVMIWYTYQMEGLLSQIVDRNMAAFLAAEELETALANQKGFVSYYFLDGDPDWLRRLGEYRQIINQRLKKAKFLVETDKQKNTVECIESEYGRYIKLKDRVIDHYKAGERDVGALLHKEVRTHFLTIQELTKQYKDMHAEIIKHDREQSHKRAKRLRIIAGTAMLMVTLLAMFLVSVLVHHILEPVRRLAREATRKRLTDEESGDEIRILSRRVHGLIEDFDHTHFELEKSREHLLQAKKLALVGKLAAGVAHSIRNPLTSVKMRLFSLERTLSLSDHQKEDFEVISEEIKHIDNILQNFLEFSRPPRLRTQKISPSDVVDLVVQLLRHRLESYNVDIKIFRQGPLPDIQADPEQLKELLINLIVNSCESMAGGGKILIHEEESFADPLGKVVVIRLADNGPGVPESLQEKIFQPFFTTKEEGSGLGLSIAARIVEEHGGWLDLVTDEGEGSTFVITFPVPEW